MIYHCHVKQLHLLMKGLIKHSVLNLIFLLVSSLSRRLKFACKSQNDALVKIIKGIFIFEWCKRTSFPFCRCSLNASSHFYVALTIIELIAKEREKKSLLGPRWLLAILHFLSPWDTHIIFIFGLNFRSFHIDKSNVAWVSHREERQKHIKNYLNSMGIFSRYKNEIKNNEIMGNNRMGAPWTLLSCYSFFFAINFLDAQLHET